MPTYKNNTDSRIVDQGVSFDPYDNAAMDNGQEKTSDKILVEQIIAVDTTVADFTLGELATGGLSGATGIVAAYDVEDCVLSLVECTDTFAPIKVTGGTPVTGETVSAPSGASGELVSQKTKLTKTLDTPYYVPVIKTDLAGDTDAVLYAGIDMDKIKAVAIDCTAQSVKVSLSVALNVVKDILLAADDTLIISTDGNVNRVILTCLADATAASVYQFESLAQAESYFA